MKKKKYIYTSVAAIVLSLASYQTGRYHQTQQMQAQDNRIAYIDSVDSHNDNDHSDKMKAEELTPEEINAKEGINAEQIVVKINDKGYVTSHGDHYHYYNGKVPFDAIISEELIMKSSAYKLKDSDIINEVKDGYIIKVDGQYYLYLKEGVKPSNVRTKEEITRQQKEGKTDDKESSTDKKDEKDKKDKKDKKEESKKSNSSVYRTDDGYVFSPTDVIDDLGDGFLVPHGDHFHFIPKKDLSASELAAAQNYWNNKSKGNTSGRQTNSDKSSTSRQSNSDKHSSTRNNANSTSSSAQNTSRGSSNDLSSLLNELYALPVSQRHREADGLVFDPAQITKRTAAGVVVPHGDHFHFIPYSHLSDLERRIAQMIPIGNVATPAQPESSTYTPAPTPTQPNVSTHTSAPSYETPKVSHESSHSAYDKPSTPSVSQPKTLTYFGRKINAYGKGLDGKPYDTSDGYVFSKASIDTVDDSGLTARHENHFHYIGFGELEAYELKQVEDWVKEKQYGYKPSQPTPPTEAPTVDLPTPPTEITEVEVEKPTFEAQKVKAKETRDGKVGYILTANGVDYFYPRTELDLTQISFAEQQLMIQSKDSYVLDVVAPKAEELEPKFYLTAKSIKLHAANATYDTGSSFIIPHIDHIHVVDYKMLTKEEIASVKYIMQHPEVRPKVWTEGHEAEMEEEAPTTNMGTPVRKREGLANWQIVHFEGELETARKEGRYTTEEGYIFTVTDVLADKAKFFESTNQFGIPQAGSDDLLYITKAELSEQEWNAAVELYKKHKPEIPTPEVTEETSKPNESTHAEDNKETESKPTEDSASSEKETPAPEVKQERAMEIFERVAPAKIIPVEAMPYNLAYAVGFKNGRIIVPHHDHYHNIVVAWFDDTFSAPEGYTLEQLFATVKYYIENPNDRPTSDDGWGNSSPLANGGAAESQPSEPTEEEELEEEEEEEVDEFELSLKAYASDFGMDFNVFRKKLINIALAHKVSMEAFSYNPAEGTVSFTAPSGETVTVSMKDQ